MYVSKKIYSVVAVISIIALLSIGVVIEKKSTDNDEKEVFKVGVTLYYGEDIFISNVTKGILTYIEALTATSNKQIIVDILDSDRSQIEQNKHVKKFIEEAYDVMVVNTVEREEAGTIVDKAQAADIPIIFFNREPVSQDMAKWDKVYYVGSKAEQAGRMQGQILIQAIEQGLEVDKNKDGIIQYVMLEGEYGHQDAVLRTYYCMQELQQRAYETENIATDTAKWRQEEAKHKMLEWLGSYGDQIEVVMANNDEMALGAIQALGEQGYLEEENWIPVIGVDGIQEALDAVEDGYMIGTVFNDWDQQARCIVDQIGYLLGLIAPKNPPGTTQYFWVDHQKVIASQYQP